MLTSLAPPVRQTRLGPSWTVKCAIAAQSSSVDRLLARVVEDDEEEEVTAESSVLTHTRASLCVITSVALVILMNAAGFAPRPPLLPLPISHYM